MFVSKKTFAQNSPEISVPKIYDDANGKIITNPQLIENIICQKERCNGSESAKKISKTSAAQTPVEMCSNGGFEQHETTAGNTHLKHFLYTTGDPSGLIQNVKPLPISPIKTSIFLIPTIPISWRLRFLLIISINI